MAAFDNLLLIATLARALDGKHRPLVGTNSPVPATAALLARELSGGVSRPTILGSARHSFLTEDLTELFAAAARGVFDAFFASGGQIDGQANLNSVGLGVYPDLDVRWPGAHGTPLLYLMIPNVILFLRVDHTRDVLPTKVDFVSAPGVSAPGVHRPGGPVALVTRRCVFRFEREAGRFALESLHPGQSVQDILDNTGFDFDLPPEAPQTPGATPQMLKILEDKVLPEIQGLYPQFVDRVLGEIAAVASAVS
jgi:glutaconate CoA-transferase subunit B